MNIRLVGALLCATCLCACVSSGGADAIKPLASERSTSSFVDKIVVAQTPPNAGPSFERTFVAVADPKLRACAKGTKPLRLEVTITDFHKQNPAQTWLVGDSNRIRGAARLIDPATGDVVGDYDINRSVGGGGLIAAMAMGEAETKMSAAFADELCRRAFISR